MTRWREPSTWAGLGGVMAAVATFLVAIPPAAPAAPVVAALGGVAGAVAVWLRDGAEPPQKPDAGRE